MYHDYIYTPTRSHLDPSTPLFSPSNSCVPQLTPQTSKTSRTKGGGWPQCFLVHSARSSSSPQPSSLSSSLLVTNHRFFLHSSTNLVTNSTYWYSCGSQGKCVPQSPTMISALRVPQHLVAGPGVWIKATQREVTSTSASAAASYDRIRSGFTV